MLVIGATGMLGAVCLARLRDRFERVNGTQRRDPAGPSYLAISDAGALEHILAPGYDYVVNCTAVLASPLLETDDARRREAVEVNANFPLVLAEAVGRRGGRLLHVSTDGVFSGRSLSPYYEDDPPDATDAYGRTKALGESMSPAALTVRCSLVGVDQRGRRGLFEWFLGTSEGAILTGFEDQRWNGVTALQLVDAFAAIIAADRFDALRNLSHVHHFCPNPAITKYDLLVGLNQVTGRRRTINRGVSDNGTFGRVLASRSGTLNSLVPAGVSWEHALNELLATR